MANTQQIISGAGGGSRGLTPRANQIIESMLSGDVSPSASIRDAAYFGVGSGMPGSEAAQRFGYDLYGQRREARQQQGLQDLLAFLSEGRQDRALTENIRQSDNAHQLALSNRALQGRIAKEQYGPKYSGYVGMQDRFNTSLGQPKGGFQYEPRYLDWEEKNKGSW
jgi:hypothetical protein